MDCTTCRNKGCRSFEPCQDRRDEYAAQYLSPENQGRLKTASALIDNGRAGTLTRLDEIIEYCQRQGHLKIGVAYCYGLEKEAGILKKLLRAEGFQVNMVSCTVDGLSETDLNPEKHKEVVSCNPLGQAAALNRAKVEFVILMGLCLGHDVILQNALDTDFSTFVVKDRVLGHNPILALDRKKAPEDKFMEEIPNHFYILKVNDFIKTLEDPDLLTHTYLLDLRPARKHQENGISGSLQCLIRHLPCKYKKLLPDKKKKVIVYCNGGQMSMYATMYLRMKGYQEVFSLAGGFTKYLAEMRNG